MPPPPPRVRGTDLALVASADDGGQHGVALEPDPYLLPHATFSAAAQRQAKSFRYRTRVHPVGVCVGGSQTWPRTNAAELTADMTPSIEFFSHIWLLLIVALVAVILSPRCPEEMPARTSVPRPPN